MKKIRQFRYSGDRAPGNSPADLTENTLIFGNLFSSCPTISQMGIQGRPGTKFYLNGSEFPIVLGETGIYEIDLEDRGTISEITFVKDQAFEGYSKGDRLLVDIIYEG